MAMTINTHLHDVTNINIRQYTVESGRHDFDNVEIMFTTPDGEYRFTAINVNPDAPIRFIR